MREDAETPPELPDQHAEEDAPRLSQPMDPWLFFAATALSVMGLVMVYSAGSWLGHTLHATWEHFLVRQAIFLGVGFVLMVGLSRLDYRVLRRFAPHLMLGAIALLLLVLVVGDEINGARRWIRVGSFGLQPSEVAKLTLAIFLAATLARQGERIRRFKTGFMPVMTISGFTMLCINVFALATGTVVVGAATDYLIAHGVTVPLTRVLLTTDALAISSALFFALAARMSCKQRAVNLPFLQTTK